MKVLVQSSKATRIAILNAKTNVDRYSKFPIHETEFWGKLFAFASDARTAQKVLDELSVIENEPCIENERVWNNVRAVRSKARNTLMH